MARKRKIKKELEFKDYLVKELRKGNHCGSFGVERVISEIEKQRASFRSKEVHMKDGVTIATGVFSFVTKKQDGEERLSLAKGGLIVNELIANESGQIFMEKLSEGELLELISNLMDTYRSLRSFNQRLKDIGIDEDEASYDD